MLHFKPVRAYKTIFWGVTLITLLFIAASRLIPLPNRAVSNLLINEFVASNGTSLTDADGDTSDWIELHNPGPLPLNLAGYALSDDPAQPDKWPLPDQTLAASEYLLIFASGKDRRAGPELHTNFKLNADGEIPRLYNLLDNAAPSSSEPVAPAKQLRDIAYGRLPNSNGYGYLSPPTPGQANNSSQVWSDVVAPLTFSVEHGFFEQPFQVELATTTPGAFIRYTTDGSQPTSTHGQLYRDPLQLTSTTLLRAIAFKEGLLPATVETRTYLFVADVLAQSNTPPGFPSTWGTHQTAFKEHQPGDPVKADYELDPYIVNDPRYKNALREGLQALPTLSIVLDMQGFTDLYSHPRDRGKNWERPASIELIDPQAHQPGFQINAGIRMHGGVGRNEFIPKHSFRLFFRGEYGSANLNYPLFPDSPVSRFDTLVLRSNSDRSFAGTGPIRQKATYIHDEWLRASQLEMSGVGSHGSFAHLYINGLYWGLYNLIERPDEAFMSAYFGGQAKEWFVANQDGPLNRELNPENDALNLLFLKIGFAGRSAEGFENRQDYARQILAEIKPYFDINQFFDYIILNWYAGTEDWPENNWYAAVPPASAPIRLFVWDGQETWEDGADIVLGKSSSSRLNIVKPVFEILMLDPDLRLTFADRLYKHLYNHGALTTANAQARWLHLSQLLRQPILAESARWGDARATPPISQEDWLAANDNVLNQMEGNNDKLITLARQHDYYPLLNPPTFNQHGGLVNPGFQLELGPPALPQAEGAKSEVALYFTRDGSDPRLPGGQLSSTASLYIGPVPFTQTTTLKARALHNGLWSALNEAVFRVTLLEIELRVTEIMYNPLGGNDYEFIELKNTGEANLPLAGLSFEGIRFTFPPDALPLPPAQLVTLVGNAAAFAERYPGVLIGGVYDGRLSNAGEIITLKDAEGQVIFSTSYNDEAGWPISPDGRGDSLVLVKLDGDPNDPKNWRASTNLYGSPGQDDGSPNPE